MADSTTRNYNINGETLLRVKGAANSSLGSLQELGLAVGPVRITFEFRHHDIIVDDFGPDIPAEVLWMLATANISTDLIHYDNDVLEDCIKQSMAGANFGVFESCGTPLGGFKPIFDRDNHYISLNLLSPVLNKPWRFRTTYLTGPPLEIPIGTKVTIVRLMWRAVPYSTQIFDSPTKEPRSKGTILWDRTLDT